MEYANANANAVMISEHEPHPDESYLYDLNIDEDNDDAHFDDVIDDYYQFSNEISFSGHPTADVGGRKMRTPLSSKRFQSPMAHGFEQQNATSKV